MKYMIGLFILQFRSKHLPLSVVIFLIMIAGSPQLKAQAGNIGINGFLAVDAAQQGSTVKAAVVLDIPKGFAVNSNKPLSKYAIATVIRVDAPRGVRVSPVIYPRAVIRSFKFIAEKLSVYEGRTVLRFTISVPANFALGQTNVRVKVQYQSCSDKAFSSPRTIEVVLPVKVVTQETPVKHINGILFGGGRN
jgi:hypothetical protein